MAFEVLSRLEATRPFTEAQAWTLYRIVALSEAFGWTLLIVGILIRHYKLPGHNIAVPIAGQIHGTIFLIYFGVLATVYSSLRWPRTKFLIALLAGIPPYGSLVFEQWEARRRHANNRRIIFRSFMLSAMTNES